MRTRPWLQVVACGMAVCVGSVLGIPSPVAADESPAENDAPKRDVSSGKDDETSPVESQTEGTKQNIKSQKSDLSDAANTESQSPVRNTDGPASESALASALLGSLSAEHMKSLGQMLEQDWKDRPEWGDMAVAILKNDFMRPGAGWWKPGTKRYDWNWLGERLDANKDGRVERDEFTSDVAKADQLFERLDRDGDGKLTAVDFDYSESSAPAFMNVAGMKNIMANQLFNRLDKDSNGRVTMQELAELFRYADKEELGFLTPEDLRFAIDDPPSKKRAGETEDKPAAVGPSTPVAALRMFLRGELGWLSSGPQLNDSAPDFTLPTHDGTATVKLSDSFGKRPVVLVFGSFT